MIKIWKRSEIQEVLEQLPCTFKEIERGGDYDLPGFRVRPIGSQEWIDITPFKDPLEDPELTGLDDVEVHSIELRTDGDCRGGLQSSNPNVCGLYAQIKCRLTQLGFRIINTYEEIF